MLSNLLLTAISLSAVARVVTGTDPVVYISPTSQWRLEKQNSNPDQTCTNSQTNIFSSLANGGIGEEGQDICPSHSRNSTTPFSEPQTPREIIPWYSAHQCALSPFEDHQYCIYHSPTFASSRSVVLISSPSVAPTIFNSSAFTAPSPENQPSLYPLPSTPPPFIEKDLPGRGKGLIANRTIARGELILLSRPVLIVSEETYDTLNKKDRLPFQREAVGMLGAEAKRLFDGLAGHWGGDEVDDRIMTNAFGYTFGQEGKNFGVVVPEAARHSYIKSHWGFSCTCSHCTAPRAQKDVSDTRTEQIVHLRKQLLNFIPHRGFTATPAMALELIELYEVENLYASRAEGFMLAAARYCIWEDEKRTREYAQLALDNWLMWEMKGKANFELLEELVKEPKGSWCWALGARQQEELVEDWQVVLPEHTFMSAVHDEARNFVLEP
ncbi:hypothetical protein HYFRA_00005653 [Hymenoscyphus fraxineus]|uniref:SET domain-containing protein n=1 Tax=Hymenoscyphus fraxineus TaxID=746836 RepID=A0A9N9KQX3_9HELO|nr:hypothetical protein HYFRA_00005653 [Hymenoscyphus fraxineus]